jgi:GTP pyrophosphokinase
VLFAAPKYLPETQKAPGFLRRRGGGDCRGRREALPAAPRHARHAERAERDPAQDGPRHGRGRARGADPPREPTQTLRFFAKNSSAERISYARETLDIYAPLANRLGVGQLKWELEDLSFRFLEPELYKRIAQMLDEKRLEREQYIAQAMKALSAELAAVGVKAGDQRPAEAHLFHLEQDARQEPRLLRGVRRARRARDRARGQGLLHRARRGAQPVDADPKEFDDYISRPKGNLYQSLHTAVLGPRGRTLEVQIRTEEMHQQAEYGVAAHWQYKEKAKASKAFEQKVAWLRQLLAWRDEVPIKKPQIDDVIYVLTPQGRVIDLPAGSTPIDFAYALHSDLGHRCRGARVDGHMVKLDTPLASGQRVEIVTAKTGGPSRDWLNPERGFAKSAARATRSASGSTPRRSPTPSPRGAPRWRRSCGAKARCTSTWTRSPGSWGSASPTRCSPRSRATRSTCASCRSRSRAKEPALPDSKKQKKPASGKASMLVVGMGGLATQLASAASRCRPIRSAAS